MSEEDGVSSSLNSTDRSLYYRELTAALGQSDSSASFGGTTASGEIGGSGDATLTQLMQTMYNAVPKQKIVLPGGNENEHSFSVYGREVDIYVASTEDGPRAGSNKVKITPVVNHMWEQKYYYGHLVAVHNNCDFVAFALKGKTGGNVRILSRRTAERVLLKGFSGSVLDVAFAHSDDVTLATVDEMGQVRIYSCSLGQDGKILADLVLHLDPQQDKQSAYHRVVWCPYWPDEGDEGEDPAGVDSSKVFAFTQGEKIELLQLDVVTRDYGPGPINPADIETGKMSMATHAQPVVDAVFSPDGSALATASLDGYVKFFEVSWQNADGTQPACLHQWQPHDGDPLSFFAFLDDLKNMQPDAQFWKFAVTGSNKNQELKVWSCETWECLQTVRFLSPPVGRNQEPPCLKACIDPSAKYLVLSDKYNVVMYVLQLFQDTGRGTAHITSVSEFPLTQPCLSFAILEACTKRFKISPNDSHLDEITTGELDQEDRDRSQNYSDEGEEEENTETTTGVQIRLYAVHTRALQELLIRFIPTSSVPALGSAGSVSHDGTSLRDGLSDMSASVAGETSFVDNDMTGDDLPSVPVSQPHPPTLLTPEAFTVSASKKSVAPASPSTATNNITTTTDDVLSSTSSFTHVTGLTGQNAEELQLSPASSVEHSISAVGKSPAASVHSPKSSVHSPKSSIHSPKSGVRTPQSVTSPKSPGNNLYTWQNGNKDPELTPTNIPLPPESEDELATPKGSSMHSNDSAQMDVLEAFFNPQSPSSSQPVVTGTFDVDTLKESSDMEAAAVTGETYDENDQEVAEVLGEDLNSSGGSGPGHAAAAAAVSYDDEEDSHHGDEDRPHKPWPRAPDVTAPVQAVKVVPHVPESLDEAVMAEGVGDAEDNYSEGQTTEAEVEEEIEEVIEEAEDDDDNNDGQEEEGEQEEEEEEEEEERTFRRSYKETEEGDDDDVDDDDGGGSSRRPVRVIREVVDRTMLAELQDGLSKLAEAVVRQQAEVSQLQQQLLEQHNLHMDLQRQQMEQTALQGASMPSKDLEQQLGRVENVVVSKVERTMTSTLHKEMKILHDKLLGLENRQAASFEALHRGMVQSVGSVAQRSLETIVRNEFKHNITPVVQQSVNQLKSQMQTDVSQRLTCTDTVIKDQIGRIVRSKQTTEAIGVAVAGAIQNPIQSQLREVFQQRVAPAFEHSTQTLANQVNTAFQDGTREYTNQLKKHLEKVRQEQQQARDPILQQMSSLMESFKQNTQHMQAQLVHTLKTETSAQIKAALGSFQEQVNSGLRAAIRDEVSMAMAEQGSKMTDSLQTYLRSGAATPAPTTPDMNTVQALQDQIKSLVNKGKFNDAFLTALQAGNLEVTVYTCELVNPTTLFGSSTCPLTQPVLLSLVQQLSAELSSHFATKLNYLIEAVMVLKPNDPVTHEHVPSVMELLITKLRTYQANNPPNKDLRVLLMAATALAQQAGTS